MYKNDTYFDYVSSQELSNCDRIFDLPDKSEHVKYSGNNAETMMAEGDKDLLARFRVFSHSNQEWYVSTNDGRMKACPRLPQYRRWSCLHSNP